MQGERTSAGDQDFSDLIERCFPYDGPHSRESVADAVTGAVALVRYLSNATGPGNGRRTLEFAATVYRVAGGVHAVVAGLDQLLGQLADAMRRQAGDPTLYDDRRDRPAAETAREAATRLDEARQWNHGVAGALAVAYEALGHLGHE